MQRRRSLGILDEQMLSRGVSDRCQNPAMPQDDIDNGRLMCVIALAAVKPAEFVIFRIQPV